MHFRLYILLILTTCQNMVSGQDMIRILKSDLTDVIKADSLDLQARRFLLNGRRDSARIYLEKALELALQSGNKTIIARCYIDFGNMYLMQANYSVALKYVQMALPYLQSIDHYEVKINGILLQANAHNFSGRKDSAIYYYKQAEQYNMQKQPYRNWVVYVGLGELFNQLDDETEAEKYFNKAYSITSQKGNIPDRTSVVMLLINFYSTKNRPGAAGALIAEYNELAEERKRKKIDDPVQNLVMNLTKGKLENNVDFMKAVKESSLKEGTLNIAIVANGYIISYYEKKKKFEEALVFAREGEELAERTNVVGTIYLAKKIVYHLLQKTRKYEEACKFADDLFVLKDSSLSLERREQLYDLEKKYEFEKKQREIELLITQNGLREKEIALLTSDKSLAGLLLQKEMLQRDALETENQLMDSIVKKEQEYSFSAMNEKKKERDLNAALGRENALKVAELKKEKNLRRILIGGAAMFLLAAGVILFQYRKQKGKNLVIQKQSDDLQVLMKEIHHRVKNNLQVISSLLDLQSMTIADNQASEAVKEGKNRVQSMALIHQNLYSEGNIKGIRTKQYIVNLLQSLCDSYNITSDKVRIRTEIDDLNLDVDTMIPLGLVLNELVSNSLKYAFKDGRQGELFIQLKEEAQHLLLKVSDNGMGYPDGMNAKEGKSFGMKMIRAFAQKLKAKLDVYNNNGAVVEMQITKYNFA